MARICLFSFKTILVSSGVRQQRLRVRLNSIFACTSIYCCVSGIHCNYCVSKNLSIGVHVKLGIFKVSVYFLRREWRTRFIVVRFRSIWFTGVEQVCLDCLHFTVVPSAEMSMRFSSCLVYGVGLTTKRFGTHTYPRSKAIFIHADAFNNSDVGQEFACRPRSLRLCVRPTPHSVHIRNQIVGGDAKLWNKRAVR